ncbi:trihelix transcription factor GT-3b-like [Salvia miltiorrhiza]|uniref:trihelix transcription factor GT-3b-like n=1 Tax=Salvia miltiorrhiza TaxID=226208 RepID=UPI0025AC6DE9|nr:trihelix transcription factor GT-3b-like [Salvia miltiorrhiza]
MYGTAGDVSSHLRLLPSSSSAGAGAGTPTITYHHQLMIPLPPPFDDEFPRRDERLPHWSNQETRDLIEMRAQVEWGFTAPQRNRNLWEMVAHRMRDKGYWRTADQCKWKWKNLVSRYKGQEPSDMDTVQPFFNELHAVFTARANRLQQSQAEAVTVVAKGRRLNDASEDQSNEEFTEKQEAEEEVEVDHQAGKGSAVPKQKAGREKRQKTREEDYPAQPVANVNKNERVGLREIMRNFMQQQQIIDMQWRASMEKRAEERERFEQEWQQKMEILEKERLMMEQAWREREEERRLREERRAEQRDALLTTLLNKLIHEETT